MSVNSKNEKRTQRGLKKVEGVQGEEEKTFLKSFFLLPRQPALAAFCRGCSRRPPAPPAPAQRDWYWCSGMPCVLVDGNVSQIFTRCRLFWRQSGFDLRHARHIRGRAPRTPHGGVQRSPVFPASCKNPVIFPKSSPAFCFFECQLKKRKAYPKRFEKGSGGAGEEEKTFLKSFCFLPRQT